MLEKLRGRLVDDARCWYKMWSSWLAGLFGLIVTAIWNDPTIPSQLLSYVPEEYRAGLSPIVLAVVSGLPVILRLIKQRPHTPAPTSEAA